MSIITVIGRNGNLARFLLEYRKENPDGDRWNFLSHGEINAKALSNSDVVINLAMHPALAKGVLTKDTNLDLRLVELIKRRDTHYIMASTRMVYGDSPLKPEITINTDLSPTQAYGEAKIEIENQLRQVVPEDKLSVLRLTNIVGFNDLKQQGTVGHMFNQLAETGNCKYNFPPKLKRDFLPQYEFCKRVVEFSGNPKEGVFNLGSGVALTVNEFVGALCSGFNENSHAVYVPKDGFANGARDLYLKTGRLNDYLGNPSLTKDQVVESLKEEGRKLSFSLSLNQA